MKYYIYTLSCPITKEVKYVGKSKNPKRRYYQHIYEKTVTYKNNWIKSLQAKGLKPILDVIDEYDCEKECFKAEVYWISQFKTWGFKLANLSNGGEGYSDIKYNIKGQLSPKAKITNEKALVIIEDLVLAKLSLKEMQIKHCTTRNIILNIQCKTTWKHLTENIDFNSITYKKKVKERKRTAGVKKRPIKQLNLNGSYKESFESVYEASLKTGYNRSSIQNCLSGKYKTSDGFIWKYI